MITYDRRGNSRSLEHDVLERHQLQVRLVPYLVHQRLWPRRVHPAGLHERSFHVVDAHAARSKWLTPN